MARIRIHLRDDGKFYFELKARNGQIQLTGRPCVTKEECLAAVEAAKTLARDRTNFKFCKTDDCEPYFVIENGHVLARSPLYESWPNAKDGVKSVQRNISKAILEDKTPEN